MVTTLKNFLELIRLPGMFTAHADILAAFLITGIGFQGLGGLFCLLAASSCLFSAGMALNDYFDFEIDLKERPLRPLPSGRISRPAALALGLGLLGAGIGFAFLAGPGPFCVSLALGAAILLYDGLLKDHLVVGPLAMASCRYFNFLMGLSLLPFDGWALIPLVTGTYIFGVTLLSQKEAEGGKAILHIGGCALALGLVPLLYYFLFLNHVLQNFSGVILAMGFLIFSATRVLALLDRNRPEDFQKTMKTLLLSLIVLDFILAAGAGAMVPAAGILLLFIPAFLSVRLFRVT